MAKKKSLLRRALDFGLQYYVLIAGALYLAHYTGYIKGTSEKDIQISEMNINEAKMITEFTLKEVEYKSKIIKLELKTDSLKKVINDNDYGKQ